MTTVSVPSSRVVDLTVDPAVDAAVDPAVRTRETVAEPVVEPVVEPGPGARGDGRERVLREAVRLFGASGFAGTSVRAVAAAAGVSPANVMHHFGSKEALKEATDDRVLGALGGSLKRAARAVLEGGDPVEVGDLVGDPAVRAYLRRVLLDGGPAGEALVADLVRLVRAGLRQAQDDGQVRAGADLEYAAVQVIALTIGPLLLGPLLPGFEERSSPAEVAARAAADITTLREGLLRS